MHISLKKRTPGQIEFGIIYGGMVLFSLAAVRFLPALTTILPSCPFKRLTGIPCPTCGSTHAVLCLAQGDIIVSLGLNPLAAIVLIAALFIFFYHGLTILLNTRRISMSLREWEKDVLRVITIFLAVVNWSYLILTR